VEVDYSAMVKQRSLGPDNMDEGTDASSSAFLDALRTRAMDDMHEAALEYGIVLKDLAVIDRQFKGMPAHHAASDKLNLITMHRRDCRHHGQIDHPCAAGTSRGSGEFLRIRLHIPAC
jgi:hypothetical protein